MISVLLLAALLLVPGCRIKPAPANATETIQKIPDRLVDAAEMRVDLRQVSVYLHEIHELLPQEKAETAEASLTSVTLSHELEEEFVLALHSRMNLVEGELVAPPGDEADSRVPSMAKYFGCSHVLVGDYSHRDSDLLISIRLVDVDSMIIIAAAGGSVSVSSLSDAGRRLLRRDSLRQGSRLLRR